MLEIGLGDDGIDAPLPDLVDDGVRIDDPPLHETRPQEQIVDDRRDPTIGNQSGVFQQIATIHVERERDRAAAKLIRPCTRGRNAAWNYTKRVDRKSTRLNSSHSQIS